MLLAVDGGNSKTDVVLLGVDGSVLASLRGPTVSHQQVGLAEASRRLASLVDQAVGEAVGSGQADAAGTAPVRGAVLCLAGVDLPSDERALARAHARVAAEWVVLENDAVAPLRAGSPDGWGVGVVVGAGINAVGIAPDGRRARFAGLGAISGDRGGGGSLGLDALGAAVRAVDRRGPRTSLERLVPARFGLRRPMDVTLALYRGRLAEVRLDDLAPVAVAAARDGDAVALALLDDLAAECAAFAIGAIRRLRLTRSAVPVVLSGGVARGAAALLAEPVARRVGAVAPAASVTVLHAPPVVGAALLALDRAAPGDTRAADRLRAALTADRFEVTRAG